MEWLQASDMTVTHISRSGRCMILNCAMVLTLRDDWVAESFREGYISPYSHELRNQPWVNCHLSMGPKTSIGWSVGASTVVGCTFCSEQPLSSHPLTCPYSSRAWIDRVQANGFDFGWPLCDLFYNERLGEGEAGVESMI